MEPIYRAMVNGGACGFLVRALSYTGGLAPQDRGLWRAKGLAVTCFGNIVERMNPRQLGKHITQEMIDAVEAFKEREDAPLVQKGQAIYTLQRYTKATTVAVVSRTTEKPRTSPAVILTMRSGPEVASGFDPI